MASGRVDPVILIKLLVYTVTISDFLLFYKFKL